MRSSSWRSREALDRHCCRPTAWSAIVPWPSVLRSSCHIVLPVGEQRGPAPISRPTNGVSAPIPLPTDSNSSALSSSNRRARGPQLAAAALSWTLYCGLIYLSGAASGRPQRQVTRAEMLSVVSLNLTGSSGEPKGRGMPPAPHAQLVVAKAELQAVLAVAFRLPKS